MLYEDYTREIIGLKDTNLTKVEQKADTKYLQVRMNIAEHECPRCGSKTSRIHDYRLQPVKDLDAFGSRIVLRYCKRRYVCLACGKRFAEKAEFLPRYHRSTTRLNASLVNEMASVQSMKEIARRHHVSATTAVRLFDHVSYPRPHLPQVLSLDEFKGNAGGSKFQCILTDPSKKKVLDILESRKSESLYEYFGSFKDRSNVKYVVIDMSTLFRDVATGCFKNAVIVADKYHVVRQVTWAFERVRIEVQQQFHQERRRYFKRSRSLLLKRFKNLSSDERLQVEAMLQISVKLRNAYMLKEKFYDFMQSTDLTEAKKRLLEWNLLVNVSNIPAFTRCFETFTRWDKYILNAFTCPYTNGYTEGVNNKIKVLKRNAYGIRNFERFRNRILHMMAA